MKLYTVFFLLSLVSSNLLHAQLININYSAPAQPIPAIYQPGAFVVPKTTNGANDLINNGVHYNSIRTIDIEEAMNHWSVSSIADVMVRLEVQKSNILLANSRCDKLIIPILKMPAWLSSSTNTAPAAPGFQVLNAVPPANYNTWNTLMDSIVDKINNQWGLSPYYEIWNEPDGDYWQGTESEYFELYKNTFFAIKDNHPTARVGGPTVSNFRSTFGAPFAGGFLTNAELDASIIGRVIDSCASWGAVLDFISWHKFEVVLHSLEMEINYLNQKLISTGHGVVPYLVSEWNLPFTAWETSLDPAFMVNYVEALNQLGISGEMVAAWQDFQEGTTEFHGDYGLLTWGALHKPSWKALLLLNKLKGVQIDVSTSNYRNLNVLSSYQNDTIKVLISNYSLPGLVEATLSLYFDYDISETDLASNGYTAAKLDSIYKGLIILSGVDYLSTSINSVIPTYQSAQNNFLNGRDIDLKFPAIVGTHSGVMTLIDSSHNNVISRYDSLITAGYVRADAVNYLYPNDYFIADNISMTDSMYSFHLNPNGVALIEFYTPEIVVSANENKLTTGVIVYPNPTTDVVSIQSNGEVIEQIKIYDLNGRYLQSYTTPSFSIKDYPTGIYFLIIQTNDSAIVKKIIRQ